jgi:hypothetical protein
MLFVESDEKEHDGTDLITLQAVIRLMTVKSKYNFLNQCYNDIIKLIIDLISSKHFVTYVIMCTPFYIMYARCQYL